MGTITQASTAIITQPLGLPVSFNLRFNQSFMTVFVPLWSIYFSQPSRYHPVGETSSKWHKCVVSVGSLTLYTLKDFISNARQVGLSLNVLRGL